MGELSTTGPPGGEHERVCEITVPDEERSRATLRQAVRRAMRSGFLTLGPCAEADGTCAGRVGAHHDDPSRPLDGEWLCRSHLARRHPPGQ